MNDHGFKESYTYLCIGMVYERHALSCVILLRTNVQFYM